MAGDFSSDTEYPPYVNPADGVTKTKKHMLRGLAAEILPNCPNAMAVLFRINNTKFANDCADADTIYDPADLFSASE